jgi:hypothetical protein
MTAVWRAWIAVAVLAGSAWADEPAPELDPSFEPSVPAAEPEPEPAAPAAESPTSYDRPVFQQRTRRKEIVVMVPGERSRTNKVVLGSMAVVGGIAGLIGAYYHLDSRSAALDVSATTPTGRAWTAERAALVQRADRSGDRAAVAYGIGGALIIAAAVAFIVTDPPTEREVLRPHVSLARGEAVFGGAWTW